MSPNYDLGRQGADLGLLPMPAVMIPEPMYQAMIDESRKIGTFGHGFTYSGHPVAAAVALKTLEIYARERIAEQAARKRRSSRHGWRRSATTRWSATRAASAWSARSSWWPTRRQTPFDPKAGVGPRRCASPKRRD